jgi:hypothetical protein
VRRRNSAEVSMALCSQSGKRQWRADAASEYTYLAQVPADLAKGKS